MKQEALLGSSSMMSSSVQFGSNSESDSMSFDFENTAKPVTRERYVVSRYSSRPRISGFPPSSLETYSNARRRTSFPRESERSEETVIRRSPFKSTQRPYTTSCRVHQSASSNEALRADVLLKANRLFGEHTVGASAQVPLKFRPWTTSSTSPQPHRIPLPVEPVRGEVVLPSLRSLPTPPTNSVRTRAKGELVYNGPSHLLREQAKAGKESCTQSNIDWLQDATFGLSNLDSIDNGTISSIASLSFVSAYGSPCITTVSDLASSYQVDPPPDKKRLRKEIRLSKNRGSERSASSTIATSPLKSKFLNMPRFPVR